jgi:hypothetical protein
MAGADAKLPVVFDSVEARHDPARLIHSELFDSHPRNIQATHQHASGVGDDDRRPPGVSTGPVLSRKNSPCTGRSRVQRTATSARWWRLSALKGLAPKYRQQYYQCRKREHECSRDAYDGRVVVDVPCCDVECDDSAVRRRTFTQPHKQLVDGMNLAGEKILRTFQALPGRCRRAGNSQRGLRRDVAVHGDDPARGVGGEH